MKKVLYLLGVLAIVGGLIFGIMLIEDAYNTYGNIIGFVYILSGFVSGILFIGFGKVIELLESINDTLTNIRFK
ncbi:MAG: hypothetical protein K9K76_09970 [Halanaerobiales bacterium]|nr:hypothetical protein [Halanaerobiales bacterium]